MTTVLVTGAGGNASRNFVASLRLGGTYRVIGADVNKYHLQTCDVDARYSVPPCSDESYLDRLNEIIEKESVDLVHPQPDVEVEFLSLNRQGVKAKMFLPPHEQIVLCHDKFESNQRFRSYGVPVPKAYLVRRVESIPTILDLIGGQTAWLRAVRGAGSRAALPIRSKRQAEEWIHYWRANRKLESRDFMLSEFLPGTEYALQSLWYEGELITSAARERIEYMFGNLMPSGQSSSPSVARSVHNDTVNDTATRAIMSLQGKPHGIYCVDMKENEDGVPCVTEINIGRFFTTSNFFSVAGCNMPHMYTQLAMGQKIPEQKKYNAVEADLYWIRSVDYQPKLIKGAEWQTTKQQSSKPEKTIPTQEGSTANSVSTESDAFKHL